MNLSIVITEFIGTDGTLKTYRFVPKNSYNKVVVDRLSDIFEDVRGNTDRDIGLLRVYNSDKCELVTTNCRIKNFQVIDDSSIEFTFEHMYIPVGFSSEFSTGIYNFILPLGYRLSAIHIVDPFDTSKVKTVEKKHFQYHIYWDKQKRMQIVQMYLKSNRGNFSFILTGRAVIDSSDSVFCESKEQEIVLDQDIQDFFFDEGIKRSFWQNLKQSIIIQPNFNGIGIDLKTLLKK